MTASTAAAAAAVAATEATVIAIFRACEALDLAVLTIVRSMPRTKLFLAIDVLPEKVKAPHGRRSGGSEEHEDDDDADRCSKQPEKDRHV